MSAYDPSFEIDLSPHLLSTASLSDAIRATLALPVQIRAHGARIAMFLGAAHLARDVPMRDGAMDGLNRALQGFDAVRSLLAGWDTWPELHPALPPLFQAAHVRESGAVPAIDRYRKAAEGARTALDAMGPIDPTAYDAVMRLAYTDFHPAMLILTERMAEAGHGVREDARAAAQAAQARTLEARDRIETIARTVRLISFNARVEAARAGEAGRTFGVIAQEIKTLSEQAERANIELGESVDEIMETFRMI